MADRRHPPHPNDADEDVVRWYECHRKKPYTAEEAVGAAARTTNVNLARGAAVEDSHVIPFVCRWEDHWHVGHVPANAERGDEALWQRRVVAARHNLRKLWGVKG
jgi:hypothetical protein